MIFTLNAAMLDFLVLSIVRRAIPMAIRSARC